MYCVQTNDFTHIQSHRESLISDCSLTVICSGLFTQQCTQNVVPTAVCIDISYSAIVRSNKRTFHHRFSSLEEKYTCAFMFSYMWAHESTCICTHINSHFLFHYPPTQTKIGLTLCVGASQVVLLAEVEQQKNPPAFTWTMFTAPY